jgi:hypothetical protein
MAGAMVLALWLAAGTAQAQSVSDYRLPGATQTPDPRSQGPVDSENPVVSAPRPTASAPPTTPTATATPTPQPTSAPAAGTSTPAAPRGGAGAPARRASPLAPAAIPTPASSSSAEAPPSTPALPPFATPTGASPLPTPPSTVLPTTSEPPSISKAAWPWPWLAGAAALLVALLGLGWWWRRKPEREPQVDFEPPVVASPRAEPETAPPPAPSTPAPAPAPTPPAGLAIELEARRMNASLMATTLSYQLRLTNHGDEPLSALAIEGDMVAAHASLPPERQIASSAERLELRHALVSLAPGESAEFTGDMRLPLASITPIRAGEAAYFVPLARLRVEASTAGGSALIETQTFVIGEVANHPGAPLRPFRLDLGPRNYQNLGQRAVS